MKRFLRGIIRGLALFFGVFSALNIIVSRFGTARAEDIWWIQLSNLPSPVIAVLSAALAILLICFALKPAMSFIRRVTTTAVCILYAVFALLNTVQYYRLLAADIFTAKYPVPFSLFIMLVFLAIALIVWTQYDRASSITEFFIMGICALMGILLFPLAQFYTFGYTDYTRPADVAIVFGARAFKSGNLSNSLKERVNRSIELYDEGLVPTLLFTGGIDADGVNEPEKMRDYAINKGVNPADILIDDGGNDTDLSVNNTVPMLKELEAERIIAVSQFYHLPRIKMAYRGKHVNVLTVPALEETNIPQTPYYMLRETAAFWAYWLRSGVRDLRAY